MKVSIGVPPQPDSWKLVKRAEDLGYETAWFYDSPMLYSEVYACLALAAERTERIKLALGVAVPRLRSAPVTAAALGTLNLMAPGRMILGLGSGFTARYVLGHPPVRMAEFREYIETCRALLRGEEAWYSEGGPAKPVRFLHPDRGYLNLKDPVPIYVSAFGPKSQKICGELADGWLTFGPHQFSPRRLGRVREAAREAGRDPASLEVGLFSGLAVLRDGETVSSPRIRQALGPFGTVVYHGMAESGLDAAANQALPGGAYGDYLQRLAAQAPDPSRRHQRMHYGHMIFTQPWEDDLISDDLLRRSTIVGTAEEVREQVDRLRQLGVTKLVAMVVPGREEVLEDIARALI